MFRRRFAGRVRVVADQDAPFAGGRNVNVVQAGPGHGQQLQAGPDAVHETGIDGEPRAANCYPRSGQFVWAIAVDDFHQTRQRLQEILRHLELDPESRFHGMR